MGGRGILKCGIRKLEIAECEWGGRDLGVMALLRPACAGLRRVLAWSSGAPSGVVATVGADDEAGLSLAKVGAARLDGGAFVAKEEGACLGGEAVGSGIGVPIFGINPSRGDKVVPAPINITFRGHA